jgi:hypothetical protein
MVFAYLSPDTLLPMTSVLAAAVGVAAMFGRGSLVFAMRCLKGVVRLPHRVARGVSRDPHSSAQRPIRNDRRQRKWRGPVAISRGVPSNPSANHQAQ